MSKPLRVVFMGTPPFAVASLEALWSSPSCAEVVGVVTAPDRPAGRGMKLQPSAVKQAVLAREAGTPLLQPEKLRDAAFLTQLDALAADLYVVVAFRMLPAVVFERPPLGTINLHASLLPDLRGAAPIHWALLHGYTQTGVTTFYIQQQIDTGRILDQAELVIQPTWHAGDLHDALASLGAELLTQTVCRLADGDTHASLQVLTGEELTAPKLSTETGQLDFSREAVALHNQVRGLSPNPGAYTQMGNERLKVFQTTVTSEPPFPAQPDDSPGKVRVAGGRLFVATNQYWLELLQVQPPGKRVMTTKDWLLGRPDLPEFLG